MKKLTKIFILITLLAVLIPSIISYANDPVQREYAIYLDGKPVNFTSDLGHPTYINGRTLVPLRIISENMAMKWIGQKILGIRALKRYGLGMPKLKLS